MYINDITESITSDIRLFADDCILYRSISSIGDCVALQHDIDTLLAWSNTWKMHFNPSKCQVMSVTRQRKRLPFVYRLGEVVLPCVASFTYLGVVISSDLRWNLHTDMVTAKATRTLNLIRRNLYRCPQNIKSLAYTTLVRPLLEYASAAWDPYTGRNVKDIEMVQRRAARFVTKEYGHETSVGKLVSDLGWQTLQKRRQNARLAVFHRAQSGWPGLSDVVLGLRRQSRPTRSSSDTACTYSRLQTRTDCYKFSFLPRTITDWDSLDAAVRGQRSLASFRQLLGGCPVGASRC